MLASELFKTAIMTPLAQQVVGLGVCSNCHKKALRFIHSCEHFTSWQCKNCLHVFMLEPSGSAAGAKE